MKFNYIKYGAYLVILCLCIKDKELGKAAAIKYHSTNWLKKKNVVNHY